MSRYENYAIKNNVFGTLSAPISSLATTIQLWDWQGQRFSVNQLATLENIENWKIMKREIVLITAINWDVLTVERKYAPCPVNDDANTQSQTSFSFDTSDTISVYITSEHFDNIENWFTNAEAELDWLNYDWNARMKVIKAISWTALKIDIVAWVYRCWWDTLQFAGQTDISVNDNATNYVMADWAGTIQISTSSRDTRYTRLAEVVCSGWVITSISDWRSDVVGGTLWGLEIHSLTEKTSPVNADELVLADSETSYTNKRVKMGNVVPMCFYSNVPHIWRSDSEDWYCVGPNWNYAIGLLKYGMYIRRNWTQQVYWTNKTPSWYMIYNWYVYYSIVDSNTCYVYRCKVSDDISVSANWSLVISKASSSACGLLGFDWTYIILVDATSPNKIYQYDTSFNLVNTLTLDWFYYNWGIYTSVCWQGKYMLFGGSWDPNVEFLQDGTKTNMTYETNSRKLTNVWGFLYMNYSSSNYPWVPLWRY